MASGTSSQRKETTAAQAPGISFAEFVQCYQAAVAGMQCIQQITGEDTFDIRRRAVDRTAGNVRSFGPDGGESSGKRLQQGGKSPRRFSSNSYQDRTTNTSMLSNTIFGGDDATGELEEEIDYLRKLLAVKDKQLVRVLTDHAHNVESISYETDKKAEEIRLYIRRRRRRRRLLRRALLMLLLFLLVFGYHIGVIRIAQSNSYPRVSLYFNELVERYWLAERDELESLKQDALREKYRISELETQERHLRDDLKAVKVKLDVTTQDLKVAQENLRRSSSSAKQASSVALDSCRTEMRKAREEAASLRLGRKEECEKNEHELLQEDATTGWFRNLLLGPFQGMLAKSKVQELDN